MIKRYYILFDIKANVNYLYIFSLYDIAEYNTATKLKDTIHYVTIIGLADKIDLFRSAVIRMIDSNDYSSFSNSNKNDNKIILQAKINALL